MTKPGFFRRWVLQNGSYKIVALFVALVLWVAILGRKDFVISYEVPLTLKLPKNTEQIMPMVKTVRVKVGGPRLAIKRFREGNQELVINLSRVHLGRTSFRIQENDFFMPAKVRLIAISPSFLSLEVARKIEKKRELEKNGEEE